MRLLFTRHGESHANLERVLSNRSLPHALTERGREQSRALARSLEEPLLAIYASPIPRAQETAQLVAEHVGLPVREAEALREFDCGVMEGRSDEEAWRAHHAVVQAWEEGNHAARIEGGESFLDLEARFVPFVRALAAEHQGLEGAVLLVSHGSLLHLMLPRVLANVPRDAGRRPPLGNGAVVVSRVQGDVLTCVRWDTLDLTR